MYVLANRQYTSHSPISQEHPTTFLNKTGTRLSNPNTGHSGIAELQLKILQPMNILLKSSEQRVPKLTRQMQNANFSLDP